MRDVSEATRRIALDGRNGETYHIATERMVTIRDLVAMILQGLGRDFAETVDMAPERPGKDQAYRLDSGKLRRELGWRDEVPLEQGIAACVAWAERYRDHLLAMPSWNYEHRP
jgi:dTDP-glucose 4,6-dehydratase